MNFQGAQGLSCFERILHMYEAILKPKQLSSAHSQAWWRSNAQWIPCTGVLRKRRRKGSQGSQGSEGSQETKREGNALKSLKSLMKALGPPRRF